jgi:hypothetical protein
LWSNDPHVTMLAYGQQMLSVARRQHLDYGLDRAGENDVVIRVAGHRRGRTRRSRDGFHRQVPQERVDLSPPRSLGAQLLDEDPLQLSGHRLEQHKLQATVNRLF